MSFCHTIEVIKYPEWPTTTFRRGFTYHKCVGGCTTRIRMPVLFYKINAEYEECLFEDTTIGEIQSYYLGLHTYVGEQYKCVQEYNQIARLRGYTKVKRQMIIYPLVGVNPFLCPDCDERLIKYAEVVVDLQSIKKLLQELHSSLTNLQKEVT